MLNTTATAASTPPASGVEAGFALLRIVVLLLPLAGIFLQVFLRSTDTAGVATPDDSLTLIGLVVFALAAAAFWTIAEIIIAGASVPIIVALLSLFAGIGFLTVATIQFVDVLDEEELQSAVGRVGPPKAYSRREDCFYERYARGD